MPLVFLLTWISLFICQRAIVYFYEKMNLHSFFFLLHHFVSSSLKISSPHILILCFLFNQICLIQPIMELLFRLVKFWIWQMRWQCQIWEKPTPTDEADLNNFLLLLLLLEEKKIQKKTPQIRSPFSSSLYWFHSPSQSFYKTCSNRNRAGYSIIIIIVV